MGRYEIARNELTNGRKGEENSRRVDLYSARIEGKLETG
jgi:hypothetical protein